MPLGMQHEMVRALNLKLEDLVLACLPFTSLMLGKLIAV